MLAARITWHCTDPTALAEGSERLEARPFDPPRSSTIAFPDLPIVRYHECMMSILNGKPILRMIWQAAIGA